MIVYQSNAFVDSLSKFKNVYKCNKTIGQYIIKHFDIPVLSIHDNCYIFSKTEKLKVAVKKIPFIIKLFYGGRGDEKL